MHGAQQLLALVAPDVRSSRGGMPTFQFQELPGGMQLWLQASAPAQSPQQQAPQLQPQLQQQPRRLPEASSPGCRRTAVAAAAAPMSIQERAQFLARPAQLRPELAMQGPQEQQAQQARHAQQSMLASAGNRASAAGPSPAAALLQLAARPKGRATARGEAGAGEPNRTCLNVCLADGRLRRGDLPVLSAGTVAALLAPPWLLAGLVGGA
jgi:hypothetical protein